MTVTGRIHSLETCGTVDGPGIRFVIFTQGCPLRCLYCHNPDCQDVEGGELMTVDELMEQIGKYKHYLRSGGITLSGGEPMRQPEFAQALLQRCQAAGIHTALDTSGYTPLDRAIPVLEHVDLVLLDIKSYDPELYQHITSVSLAPTLALAQYLDRIHKPTWIRFVLVPGLSGVRKNMEGLAQFVSTLSNVERVEILPFHKMGEYKWETLGYDYTLKQTPPASAQDVEEAVHIFRDQGLVAIGS